MSTTPVIDTAEIARMIGVTRAHVTNRLIKRPDFPRPAINISQKTRYWRRADVLEFMAGPKAVRPRTPASRGSTSGTTR